MRRKPAYGATFHEISRQRVDHLGNSIGLWTTPPEPSPYTPVGRSIVRINVGRRNLMKDRLGVSVNLVLLEVHDAEHPTLSEEPDGG